MAEPSPEGTEQQWLHSNLSVEIVSGEDLVAKDTKGMFSSKGEGLWPPRVYSPPSVSAALAFPSWKLDHQACHPSFPTAVSSDPLVKLFLAGKEVGKTQPVMKNLNPEWNEQVPAT